VDGMAPIAEVAAAIGQVLPSPSAATKAATSAHFVRRKSVAKAKATKDCVASASEKKGSAGRRPAGGTSVRPGEGGPRKQGIRARRSDRG
jgi:hypothetical protein